MDRPPDSRKFAWVVIFILAVIVIRLGWLAYTDQLTFETDLVALLPLSRESGLTTEIAKRVTAETKNRIVIVIQGHDHQETIRATDAMADLLEEAMNKGVIAGRLVDEFDLDALSERITAMIDFKARLVPDRSRHRIEKIATSQLNWRMSQTSRFPPANLTDPILDPLGTVEEFLIERMPRLSGVTYDGVYLQLEGEAPGTVLIVTLFDGELGDYQSSTSTRQVLDARDIALSQYAVDILVSGFPVHASAIRTATVSEVQWMSLLAMFFILTYFCYVTRLIRAFVASLVMILVAAAGGLVISHGTVGLPHLVGLTMATTAIGICIDFSFHFWVHVRSGLSGREAIASIRSGLNMGFITTAVGLIAISFVSIPVLARSAVFILGALLVSWLYVLFIVPGLAPNRISNRISANRPGAHKSVLPTRNAAYIVVTIAFLSVGSLVWNYNTDDSPQRLGQKIADLVEDDKKVRDLLRFSDKSRIYLIQADSADSLLLSESLLLEDADNDDLVDIRAISRLVPSEKQQNDNQRLFNRARMELSQPLLREYLTTLQVETLEWGPEESQPYTLQWVLGQDWATVERSYVLSCEPPVCASMIQAQGDTVDRLDAACKSVPGCSRISLLAGQADAFRTLRSNLTQALVLAIGTMFIVLYLRYRYQALVMLAVPVLASISGVATVAVMGMPITAFTLAALFPLLGLSIDYVVFMKESARHARLTLRAIFASALTTTVSFAILSFSGTPAVQFFALPVAVGIPMAWLLVQLIPLDNKRLAAFSNTQ